MYKLIKIALIIFGTILYLGTLILAVRLYNFEFPVYSAPAIDVTRLPNYHFQGIAGEGTSMTEYGFQENQQHEWYPNRKCQVGDFCAFTCLADKCKNGSDDKFLKKLISTENNCYFFEGNKKLYKYKGQLNFSWDSNVYGCLKLSEFRMDYVVTK